MSLTAFLAKNALKVENVGFVPSKRFVDENTKKPMEWEIQAITGTEVFVGVYVVTQSKSRAQMLAEGEKE